MSKVITAFIFTIVNISLANAQLGQNASYGTRSLSLGGISATLNGADAIFNNFSNIGSTDSLSLLVSSERRFELQELTSVAIGAQLPVANIGNIALAISSYGLDEYKEQKFSLLYARKISSKVSISVNLDYNNLRIEQFGNKGFLSFGLGASGSLGKGFRFGVYIFNPEKIEIAEATEVPGLLKLGVQKTFSADLGLFGEVVKVIDEDINVVLGFEYKPIDVFSFRLGYNTNPGAFAFGLAYQGFPNISIEGGSQYNTVLGLTPGITVKYQRK
jgi:hypothetical protein